MTGWLREFREFAIKGNVVDLAVGVIIGAAFGKIVSSFVADLVMPVIGILLGGIHYGNLVLKVGDAQITYGKFIENMVDFVVIAFVIFMMVKAINHFRRKAEAQPQAAPPPRQEQLLEEIRDLLKQRK
ncbi:MAG TPA: large-conductance mechanosensitive channel protein MscL [Burkholderiales bacterium]|nr:large-conductance mechanosensitive channel protein MscL [Burkholderiales bacterium]